MIPMASVVVVAPVARVVTVTLMSAAGGMTRMIPAARVVAVQFLGRSLTGISSHYNLRLDTPLGYPMDAGMATVLRGHNLAADRTAARSWPH